MPSVPWVLSEALTRLPSWHRGQMGQDCGESSTNPWVRLGCDVLPSCCLTYRDLLSQQQWGSLGIRALVEGEPAPGKCWGCIQGATFVHND